MVVISAFADEIDPSLEVQMEVCASLGVKHIDVRSIGGVNVSKFTLKQARGYFREMSDGGFGVPCVGSPLGKIRIDEDLPNHLGLTRHCCELAREFEAGFVRVFSFYSPVGGDIAEHRGRVMEMLAKMADIAGDVGVTLLHENEKGIYGATPERVKDIFATVRHERLKGIFDPANFIEEDVHPLDAWHGGLAELTEYFHIKDKARKEDATCVPAGEGNCKIDEILADAKHRGFDGVLTLEPHMTEAGQFAGFSGPERFGKAVTALKRICDKVGLEHR